MQYLVMPLGDTFDILHAILQTPPPNNQPSHNSITPCPSTTVTLQSVYQEIFSKSRQLPSRLILKDDEWGQNNMSKLNVLGRHTWWIKYPAGMIITDRKHPYVIPWQDIPVFFVPDRISASATCIISYRPLLRWQMESGSLSIENCICIIGLKRSKKWS